MIGTHLDESLIIEHYCSKCGKIQTNKRSDMYFDDIEERWHSFKGGRTGQNSLLDGCMLNFELCDECTIKLVESFAIPSLILETKDYAYGDECN